MKCRDCGNELIVDRVENDTVIYVCLNPNCRAFQRAFFDGGSKTNSTIIVKEGE